LSDVKHIIQINFDYDRGTKPLPITEQWIDIRFKLFRDFTLQSILNQPHKDLEVWLICGKSHREYTTSLPWHEKVRLIYDDGAERAAEIDAPWLAVSRIDSDDLYHERALGFIEQLTEKMKSNDIVSFIFCKNLLWNRLQSFIGVHERLCSPPPFVTRIMPRKLYRDFRLFRKILLVPHGQAMRTLLAPKMLEVEGMCCIVKHGTNTFQWKQGLNPVVYSKERIERELEDGGVITTDLEAVVKTLSAYGVSRERVLRKPGWQYIDGRFQEDGNS